MILRKLFLLTFLVSPFLTMAKHAYATPIPSDLNAASVYAYFRVGDDDSDMPGISEDSFVEQIDEMTAEDGEYHVLPLDVILKAQKSHEPLAPRSIALTFEGTDASFMRNALPVLREKNIPFTIFISPGLLDQAAQSNSDDYLHWADVREILKLKLATVGLTSNTYVHPDGKTATEILADINAARARFREELKIEPTYFSYPFGEYTPAFLDAVAKQDFAAAFGQQSGVVDETQSRLTLPRFSMTDDFSDIERFRMTSASLPLPIQSSSLTSTLVSENPPKLQIKLSPTITASDAAKIACFSTGMGKLPIKKQKDGTINIGFPKAFEDNKGRVNCTIPAQPLDGSDEPRWRWLGFLISFPEKN